ncbi:MAG: nuclear transport factor 2 family protein [Acidimicrobiia bacterium]|nr:MAG: nuclear transport factor 2 family protein [Acidimicrobiia bacterium]
MPVNVPRPSPEVEAISRRLFEAQAAGDTVTLRRLLDPGPGFRAIGSDGAEWWDEHDFLPVIFAQIEEMAGMSFEVDHLEAWQTDHAAWSAARLRVRLNDAESEMRHTMVFILDAGMWRLVQAHSSDPVPNSESLGFDLTTTLAEILDDLDVERDLGGFAAEGMLTLMFTDVQDSTAHAAQMGDRRYSELMEEHLALVGESAAQQGGQVIKSVGDGALLVFSSARAGVGCAVKIQQATEASGVPYAVRIGVHAGDVIRTDTDVMGLAVNKAARVTSAADGGQIAVSSVVRELVGSDPSFTFGDSFFAELKGLEGIHELVPVEWQHATVDRA